MLVSAMCDIGEQGLCLCRMSISFPSRESGAHQDVRYHRIVPLCQLPLSQTWPIIGAIAFAVGWAAYNGGRSLFYHPEVAWDKSERANPIRSEHASQDDWIKSQLGKSNGRGTDRGDISVFSVSKRTVQGSAAADKKFEDMYRQ